MVVKRVLRIRSLSKHGTSPGRMPGRFVTTHQAASGLASEGNEVCARDAVQRPSRSGFSCHPFPPKQKAGHCPAFCFGGSGWIRTTEVSDNRFTVCPLWPLGNAPIFFCVDTLASTDDIIAHPRLFVNRILKISLNFFKTPTQHIYYITLFGRCQEKLEHCTQILPCKQKIILYF